MKKVHAARLMIKLLVAIVTGGAVLLGFAADSHALFKLKLNEGGTTFVITDDCVVVAAGTCDVVDGFLGVDFIDFGGSVGSFNIVSTSGFTDTAVIDPILMDILSFQTSSVTGGTLTITLTATDFSDTAGLKAFVAEIGGTNSGAVISYVVFIDTDNNEFVTSDAPGSVTKVTDISGFSFDTGLALVDGSYSITMLIFVTCASACSSSFDATINMPEPATLALFGIGLLMLGAVTRRQRKFGPTRGA